MTDPLFDPIAPAEVRYIKLGAGGAWEGAALEGGTIEWGGGYDPHELALAGDWEAARQTYLDRGFKPGTATGYVRELRDFYTLGADALWITFTRDQLWWSFAEREVVSRGEATDTHASRYRRTVSGWRNTDRFGRPLLTTGLSTRLTQVAGYRQTMCSVEAADYAVRRINGVDEPVVAEARANRDALVASTAALICQLHWADFELLVDLLFARAGWRRVSTLGGTMKNNDLIIEQPATGERASVQVKSAADQAVLDGCLAAFEDSAVSHRFFFVCHSPRGRLAASSASRPVHLWDLQGLADMSVANGMTDWLIARAA